jgi:hypothetical protein
MKDQYGKGNTGKPYAPTQGGFTPAGGGQGQNQGRQPGSVGPTNKCKTPQQNRPTQPNNNWGTGDKSKKDTHK